MARFERLDRYLSVRMAYDAHVTRDGRIVYISNLLGVPTPWVWDGSATGPEPLLLDDVRTSRLDVSPTGPWVVLTQDEGGTERHQLVAVHLGSRHRRQLTQDPDFIHLFGAFFPDGERFVVTANRRNGRDFDVYLGHLDGRALERIPIDGGPASGVWTAPGVFADGSVLLVEMVSPSHHRLYRLDLHGAGGHLTRLTPDEPAMYAAVKIQGSSVLAASDLRHEFARLVAIREPEQVEVLAEAGGDVEALAVGPANGVAYVVNRDGWSELHVREGNPVRDRVVETPPGVISSMRFSPDGRWLVFDVSGPDHPMDVYRMDMRDLPSVAAVTRSYRAGLGAGDLVTPDRVSIESFDGLQVPAWCYRPRGDGPFPALVVVHGGPEAQARPIFSALYQYWVSLGIVVVAPNVRGSTGYGKTYGHLDDVGRRGDAIADLAAVARWTRSQPDVDADRVVVYGGSYGGYMVMAGLTWFPELFRAGVELVGIVNLETFLEKTSPWRRGLREAEYGSLERDRDVLRALSPIHRIDRLRAPLFVGHGRNDPRVPYAEAEQVAGALQARGIPHRLFPLDDEGHGAVRLTNQRRLYAAIQDFLSEEAGFPSE